MSGGLKRRLAHWGRWQRQQIGRGYPTLNAIWTLRHYRSRDGGEAGHRILAGDMPPDVWDTHQLVLRLPEEQYDALLLKYASDVDEDGREYMPRAMARTAGCSLEAFYKRVQRAEAALRALERETPYREKMHGNA